MTDLKESNIPKKRCSGCSNVAADISKLMTMTLSRIDAIDTQLNNLLNQKKIENHVSPSVSKRSLKRKKPSTQKPLIESQNEEFMKQLCSFPNEQSETSDCQKNQQSVRKRCPKQNTRLPQSSLSEECSSESDSNVLHFLNSLSEQFNVNENFHPTNSVPVNQRTTVNRSECAQSLSRCIVCKTEGTNTWYYDGNFLCDYCDTNLQRAKVVRLNASRFISENGKRIENLSKSTLFNELVTEDPGMTFEDALRRMSEKEKTHF